MINAKCNQSHSEFGVKPLQRRSETGLKTCAFYAKNHLRWKQASVDLSYERPILAEIFSQATAHMPVRTFLSLGRCLAVSVILFTLFGCEITPPLSEESKITPALQNAFYSQNQQRLALKRWQLAGKMALIQPDEKQSARLNWQQDGTAFKLQLTNLLGVTLLSAEQNAKQAVLEYDGERYQDEKMEQLLAQMTGLTLPVEQLTAWLKAAIDPNQAKQLKLDEQGRLLYFEQELPGWGRWVVDYNGYYPATKTLPALPSRVTLRCQEITIKLMIHQWKAAS